MKENLELKGLEATNISGHIHHLLKKATLKALNNQIYPCNHCSSPRFYDHIKRKKNICKIVVSFDNFVRKPLLPHFTLTLQIYNFLHFLFRLSFFTDNIMFTPISLGEFF